MPDTPPEPTPQDKPAAGTLPAEWLETPEEEAAEVQRLIAVGHRSGSVAGALTFVGVVLMIVAFIVYSFDRMPGETRFVDRLKGQVDAQALQDANAYRYGAQDAPVAPLWPMAAHMRAREDAFLAAGLALALAYVVMMIERAKLRRQDLLVYRALAREIEKLRIRTAQLEQRRKDDGQPNP